MHPSPELHDILHQYFGTGSNHTNVKLYKKRASSVEQGKSFLIPLKVLLLIFSWHKNWQKIGHFLFLWKKQTIKINEILWSRTSQSILSTKSFIKKIAFSNKTNLNLLYIIEMRHQHTLIVHHQQFMLHHQVIQIFKHHSRKLHHFFLQPPIWEKCPKVWRNSKKKLKDI